MAELIDRDDGEVRIRRRLAHLYGVRGRDAEAAAQLWWLAEHDPAQASYWTDLAQVLARSGDVAGAIEVNRRRVELDPEHHQARHRLARQLMSLDRVEEALPHLWRLVESEPSPKHWRNLTTALEASGDVRMEVQALRRQLEVLGEDANTHKRLSKLLKWLGQQDESRTHRKIVAKVKAGEVAMPGTMGVRKETVGELEDLLAKAVKQHAEAPADPGPLLVMFRLALQLGRAGEANGYLREWMAQVLSRQRGRDEELRRQAMTVSRHLAMIGDVEGEATWLEAQLQTGRGQMRRERARLVRLMLRAGRLDAAADQLNALADTAGGDEGLLRQLARLRTELAMYGQSPALEEVRLEAIDWAPDPLLVFLHAYKTGGTSLAAGLRALFPEAYQRLGRMHPARVLQTLPAERLRQLRVIVGHFNYDKAEDDLIGLLPRTPVYIGIVRDPVARAKSIYAYFLDRSHAELDQTGRLRVPPDGDVNVVVSRWLDSARDGGWAGWSGDQCQVLSGERTARAAIRTIQARYLAVVTPDGINPLLDALAGALARPAVASLHLKQSRSPSLALDLGLEAQLRSFHAEDQALYDWVRTNETAMIAAAAEVVADRMGRPGQS